MNTNKNKIPYTAVLICITVFLSIFSFAGLLGENHRIDDLVNEHFNKLKAEDYSVKCFPIVVENQPVDFDKSAECHDQSFLLYISLLKHYDLLGDDNYSVNTERSGFWIPYLLPGEIKVSLSFQKQSDQSLIPLIDESEAIFIKDLFIIKRDKWNWVISEAHINDANLVDIYNAFSMSLDFDKYIQKTETGYQFNSVTIKSEDVTHIDKRLLRFNLQKVAELLK